MLNLNKIITNIYPEKLIEITILSFGLYPILPNVAKGALFIFFPVFGLLHYFKASDKKYSSFHYFITFSAVFFMAIISFIWTNDIRYGFHIIEKWTFFLLYPLTFFIFLPLSFFRERKKNILARFLMLYCISSTLYSIIVFAYYVHSGWLIKTPDAYPYIGLIQTIPLIGQHMIYASMFIGIGVIFSFYQLFKVKTTQRKALYLISFFINLLMLFIISRKGIILATIITIPIMTILFGRKYIYAFLMIILLLTTSTFIAYKNYDYFKLRVDNMLNFSKEKGTLDSTVIRLELWKCSWNKIKKEPFLGYGIGDANKQVTQCFQSQNKIYSDMKMNSHNQFFSFILHIGIVGLLIFLYGIAHYFYLGIKTSNVLLISLLAYFLMVMFIENILERNSGVRLYGFLINFLAYISWCKLNPSSSDNN